MSARSVKIFGDKPHKDDLDIAKGLDRNIWLLKNLKSARGNCKQAIEIRYRSFLP